MGLSVTRLALRDWRNFEWNDIEFGAMTVLYGPNAVGKTNTVEALQLLTSGQSFRKPKPAQLIREEAPSARAEATFEGDGRVIDVALIAEPGKRTFMRNGKRVQAADLSETLMSVLFNPDDLSFVKRGASYRRDELDSFGRQANRGTQRSWQPTRGPSSSVTGSLRSRTPTRTCLRLGTPLWRLVAPRSSRPA